MMSQEWYVLKDGQQKGPFTREQLTQQAATGTLGPADMVWKGGMEAWTRADQVEGLLPPAPAAPPPPAPAAPPPPAGPPPPGASPYQQGGGGFPGAPSGKQGKGLVIALAVILVGVIAIGGYFVFFANGNGESVADPDTPAPTAPAPAPSSDPVPSVPAATGADALLGEWKCLFPDSTMYFGFYEDEELVLVEDNYLIQTRYRFEGVEEGHHGEVNYNLYMFEPDIQGWLQYWCIFVVHPSGDVGVRYLGEPDTEYKMQRIDRSELDEVLDRLTS